MGSWCGMEETTRLNKQILGSGKKVKGRHGEVGGAECQGGVSDGGTALLSKQIIPGLKEVR